MNIQDYFEWNEYMCTGIDPTGCLCYFLVYLCIALMAILNNRNYSNIHHLQYVQIVNT